MYGKNQQGRNSQSRSGNRSQSFDRDMNRGDQNFDHADRHQTSDRSDRYQTSDRSDRYDRSERFDRSDRSDRYDVGDQRDGYDQYDRSDRSSMNSQYRGDLGDTNTSGDYREYNTYRGQQSNEPTSRGYLGQPGLRGASGTGRFSSPSSQGYRQFQDYGASQDFGSAREFGMSHMGSSQGYGSQHGVDTQSAWGSQPRSDYRGDDRSGTHFGKGPKGYKRSDEKIHDEVCDLLTSHYDIDASEIEVEVKDGVVTLGGAVESRRTKRLAEDAVSDMNGVVDVQNKLRVLSHDSRMLESSGDGKSNPSRSSSNDSSGAGVRTGKTASTASSNSATTSSTRQ